MLEVTLQSPAGFGVGKNRSSDPAVLSINSQSFFPVKDLIQSSFKIGSLRFALEALAF